MSILGRAVAYVALATALLAAGITLNIGKYPAGEGSNPKLSTATSDVDAELARCKTIGPEAADAGCQAVWQANRNRFFRSGKPYQDTLTDTVPVAPGRKDGGMPAHGVLPDSPPRSPPPENSPRPPVDSTGHLK